MVAALLFLTLLYVRGIWAPQIERASITCHVCSSEKIKACNDPVDEYSQYSIPYFECSRLFGEFKDHEVSYVQFRPTLKISNTRENTTEDNTPSRKQSKTTKNAKYPPFMSTEATIEEKIDYSHYYDPVYHHSVGRVHEDDRGETRVRRHGSSYEYTSQNFSNGFVNPFSFWQILSLGRPWRKMRKIYKLPTKYNGGRYEFDASHFGPFQTQGRGILRQVPKDRFTLEQITSSDWMQGQVINGGACDRFVIAPTMGLPLDKLAPEEKAARERLDSLGITNAMLEHEMIQGARSPVIASYRIVVHRLQSISQLPPIQPAKPPKSKTCSIL